MSLFCDCVTDMRDITRSPSPETEVTTNLWRLKIAWRMRHALMVRTSDMGRCRGEEGQERSAHLAARCWPTRDDEYSAKLDSSLAGNENWRHCSRTSGNTNVAGNRPYLTAWSPQWSCCKYGRAARRPRRAVTRGACLAAAFWIRTRAAPPYAFDKYSPHDPISKSSIHQMRVGSAMAMRALNCIGVRVSESRACGAAHMLREPESRSCCAV